MHFPFFCINKIYLSLVEGNLQPDLSGALFLKRSAAQKKRERRAE